MGSRTERRLLGVIVALVAALLPGVAAAADWTPGAAVVVAPTAQRVGCSYDGADPMVVAFAAEAGDADPTIGSQARREFRAGGVCVRPAVDSSAPRTTRFGPANPGPLDDSVAATFRSASYDEVGLSQDTLLYRVYGGEAGPIGGYWSRTPPTGPMQAQIDLALNPQWGNLATDVATIRVPAGTTIYEGAAAAQSLPGGGTLLGGGNQVFIPNVNSGWLVGG